MNPVRSPRVALIAPHPVQYHAGIYRAIMRSGVDLTVLYCDDEGLVDKIDVTFGISYKLDVPLLDGYRSVFLRNFRLARGMRFFSRINPSLFWRIARYDVVLIHGHYTASTWIAFFAARLFRRRLIWRGEATVEPCPAGRLGTLVWRIKRALVGYFLKHCHAVLWSCTGNREYLDDLGVPGEKLFPIPCAVDNAFFRRHAKRLVPRRDEIRAGFGIGRRDFAVLFLARFLPRKRPFDLLEVVRELRDEGIVDTFLLMVGEGESRKEMEMFAARHGLRVLFTGFKNQTEIPPYYAAADAYMMLSDFDPSPKAMNEAMNFSLPIICTRETGTAMDLIEDGGNGFLIDAGDRVALKRHLVRLAGNRALSRRMGARSAAIVAGWNFTADAKGFKEAVSHVWNG